MVMRFPKALAPVKVGVFPLLKNKPELVAKAREVYDMLKQHMQCEFDDNGNIGKRYRRQDEIGTPYCVTIDFDTVNDDTVTVRDRDTGEQIRVPITKLLETVASAPYRVSDLLCTASSTYTHASKNVKTLRIRFSPVLS